MNPWNVDAREAIKNLFDIHNDSIEKTAKIKSFLSYDEYHFIVATKGLGKSFLLLAKRKEIEGLCIVIPQGTLLDVPILPHFTLSKDAKSMLCDEKIMQLLWSISIAISIIKRLKKAKDTSDLHTSDSLKLLFQGKSYTPTAIFTEILTSVGRKVFFNDLCNDYNKELVSEIRTTNESIAIFIDNVDECFETADREIWYLSQTSLIRAMYQIARLNPSKLKLFASIRKEAFLKLKGATEMFSQYEGVSLDLSYHKNDLRGIFVKNIKQEDKKRLYDERAIEDNPIYAFLGTNTISHGHVSEDEEIFDYIYRHTLQRPRDFMQIGGAISKSPLEERNPQEPNGINEIKTLINETATKIAENYINEVVPHLLIENGRPIKKDFDKVFALIDSNILAKDKIKKICMKYNGNNGDCLDADCKICMNKTHIFCELYKIGLLGYVAANPTEKNTYTQKFEKVGEKTFDDVRLLPDSDYYLIHPVLDQLIMSKNNHYKNQIDTNNIIGRGRPWKITASFSSQRIQRPTVFISSTMDLDTYRKEIEHTVIDKNFSPIKSEDLNSPESLEKCRSLAKSCHYFVAILGKNYGTDIRKKSICEYEFDAAYKDNPNKIIVYVLEGNIHKWDKKQAMFLEKIQSLKKLGYARGSRVNVTNIAGRFEKDIVERIAWLTKHSRKR